MLNTSAYLQENSPGGLRMRSNILFSFDSVMSNNVYYIKLKILFLKELRVSCSRKQI